MIIILIIIIIIIIIIMRRSWKRYQDLALKIKRIHRAMKVMVIPIVIGALKNCKSLIWEVDCLTFLEVHSCQSSLVLLISYGKCSVCKGDVKRDDSQQRFSAQHNVATILRHCLEWLQHCSNIATLCCAKNRHCESSLVTSP